MKQTAKDKKSIVYVATNKANGKRYVGVCINFSKRITTHVWLSLKGGSQTTFHRAIRKYGRENFEFRIHSEYDDYQSGLDGEVALISELSPEYNMTKGGDGAVGFRPTQDQIARSAAKRRGKPGPWSGRELHPNFVNAGLAYRRSNQAKSAWAEYRALGPKSSKKAIICLDDGMAFDSATEAALFYSLSSSLIASVCRRKRHKTAGGRVFRFLTEASEANPSEADRIRSDVLRNRQRTAAIARASRS